MLTPSLFRKPAKRIKFQNRNNFSLTTSIQVFKLLPIEFIVKFPKNSTDSRLNSVACRVVEGHFPGRDKLPIT